MTRSSFFPKLETERVPPRKKRTRGAAKTKRGPRSGCDGCGLHEKGCITPRMECSGGGEQSILIIAEAPGAEEDKQGEQLVGQVGAYLEKKKNSMTSPLDMNSSWYLI